MKNILILILGIGLVFGTLIGCDTDNPLVAEYLKVHEERQQEVPVVDPIMNLAPYTIETQVLEGDGLTINRHSGWKITSNVDLDVSHIHAEKSEVAGVIIENRDGLVIDLHGRNHARKHIYGQLVIRTPILPSPVSVTGTFIGYNVRNEDGDLLMEVRYKNQ